MLEVQRKLEPSYLLKKKSRYVKEASDVKSSRSDAISEIKVASMAPY
jgi:hypothetical protein